MILLDRDSIVQHFPPAKLTAARKRRKEKNLTATLPPLTKSLDADVLSELRKIIRTNSMKQSKEFELCDAEQVEKRMRIVLEFCCLKKIDGGPITYRL